MHRQYRLIEALRKKTRPQPPPRPPLARIDLEEGRARLEAALKEEHSLALA